MEIAYDDGWKQEVKRELVTSALLGKTMVSKLPFKEPTGEQISLDTDFFEQVRNKKNPAPGPFEWEGTGKQKYRIW